MSAAPEQAAGLADAAHDYARRGWRVIPLHYVDDAGACSCRAGHRCPNAGKHPIGARWQQRASTSGADVEEWWRQYPRAGVGIVTGAESGLFVVDVDPAAGGADSLAELERHHGRLPYTRTVRTGSRGRHLYFTWPGFDVRNSAGKTLGPGLDVRGTGGMVVAPPSRSARGEYVLAVDAPVTDAPEWLRARLRPAERAQEPATGTGEGDGTGGVPVSAEVADHYAAEALRRESAAVRDARPGAQNAQLNNSAFALGQLVAVAALDETVVRAELIAASRASGYPARDGDPAMLATVDSGMDGGKRQPRNPWPPVGHNGAVPDSQAAVLAEAEAAIREVYAAEPSMMVDLLAAAPAAVRDPAFTAEPAPVPTASGTGPEPAGTCDDAPERSSWDPVDLTAVLDGTSERQEPTLLARTDGQCLLYPGLVHWMQGEPESGKSFVAQHTAVCVLSDGGTVVYLDHESTPDAVVGRLLALGAAREAIRDRLIYLQPEVGAMKAPASYAALLSQRAELAVIDGVTDAVGIDGGSVLDNDEVAAWMRRVPRTLARRTGAAVVCVDHTIKTPGGGGRFAIGAQSKLAGVDGATYHVEPARPLGRGMIGELVIRVGKDRPGEVRPRCGAYRATDRTQEAARMLVDSTSETGAIHVLVAPPRGQPGGEQTTAGLPRRTGVMEEVSIQLERFPEGLTQRQVRRHVPRRSSLIPDALRVLKAEHYITDRAHRHGDYPLWVSLRRYREDTDPLLDRADDPPEPDEEAI